MHRLVYFHDNFGVQRRTELTLSASWFISSRSVTPAYLQSRSTLSWVSLSVRILSLLLFPTAIRSRILALAHRGGQHGGTSRFHSPRGCAKRRLSRRPWRNSQYSPESRWRYVFLLDLIREISVTSLWEKERESIRACASERKNFHRIKSFYCRIESDSEERAGPRCAREKAIVRAKTQTSASRKGDRNGDSQLAQVRA